MQKVVEEDLESYLVEGLVSRMTTPSGKFVADRGLGISGPPPIEDPDRLPLVSHVGSKGGWTMVVRSIKLLQPLGLV